MGGEVSRNYYKNKDRQTRMYLLRKSDLCALCGHKFENLKDVTLDHIIPSSKGGGNEITNLQLAHTECNNKKGNN
jgi:5-methylcytosine-specific restriction endonuclease McrA